MSFVFTHIRSYVFMTYENVDGSFEIPSCFRNVHTRHELTSVRKVVTRSLTRFLLVYVTVTILFQECTHTSWTCVCKEGRNSFVDQVLIGVCPQETKRDFREKNDFLDSSDECFTDGYRNTYRVWPSPCPSCPTSPPSFLTTQHFCLEGTKTFEIDFFFPSWVQIEQRKTSKDPKNRFSKRKLIPRKYVAVFLRSWGHISRNPGCELHPCFDMDFRKPTMFPGSFVCFLSMFRGGFVCTVIWWNLNTYSLYGRICIDTHHILTSPL
jgi:hypothetical protein